MISGVEMGLISDWRVNLDALSTQTLYMSLFVLGLGVAFLIIKDAIK